MVSNLNFLDRPACRIHAVLEPNRCRQVALLIGIVAAALLSISSWHLIQGIALHEGIYSSLGLLGVSISLCMIRNSRTLMAFLRASPLQGLELHHGELRINADCSQPIADYAGNLGAIARISKSGQFTADRIAMAHLRNYAANPHLARYINLTEIEASNTRGMHALRDFLEKMRLLSDAPHVRAHIPFYVSRHENPHPLAIFRKQLNILNETPENSATAPSVEALVKYLDVVKAANLCQIAPRLSEAIGVPLPALAGSVIEQAVAIRTWMTQHAVQLEGITFLSLRELNLTLLPTEIGNLIALQWLSLSANKLTSLPAEIGNLRALQQLYLSHNQLTSLPAEIGNLIALLELTLLENRFPSNQLPPAALALERRGVMVI